MILKSMNLHIGSQCNDLRIGVMCSNFWSLLELQEQRSKQAVVALEVLFKDLSEDHCSNQAYW